jgi:magnesium-protoporphyrin O-methyltransferase
VTYHYGNFVDLAEDIAPADIVTLDRVICCYPDMEKLVGLSAARARKLYGLVYPRDVWWMRFGITLENIFYRLRRSPYRAFIHSTQAVENVLDINGFKRHSHRQTLAWQVAIFIR